MGKVWHYLTKNDSSSANSIESDREFLLRLPAICVQYPVLADLAEGAWNKAIEHFWSAINKIVNKVAQQIEETQLRACTKQLHDQRTTAWKKVLDDSRSAFLLAVKESFVRNPAR